MDLASTDNVHFRHLSFDVICSILAVFRTDLICMSRLYAAVANVAGYEEWRKCMLWYFIRTSFFPWCDSDDIPVRWSFPNGFLVICGTVTRIHLLTVVSVASTAVGTVYLAEDVIRAAKCAMNGRTMQQCRDSLFYYTAYGCNCGDVCARYAHSRACARWKQVARSYFSKWCRNLLVLWHERGGNPMSEKWRARHIDHGLLDASKFMDRLILRRRYKKTLEKSNPERWGFLRNVPICK